jgi:Pyridoxamine 5''-phosphate oxidase.
VLTEAQTCTLATASQDGVPEAATIRFVSDQNLDLYITTESMYRKYENMTVNPRVALVVDEAQYNLQLEGVATEVHGEAAEQIKINTEINTVPVSISGIIIVCSLKSSSTGQDFLLMVSFHQNLRW